MTARRHWYPTTLASALLILGAIPGFAQEPPRAPEPGMVVRFQKPEGGTTEAFWVRSDSAYAWIVRRGMAVPDTTSVPLADLGRLEGVVATRSRVKRGAIAGGVLGLVLGGVVVLAGDNDGYFGGAELVMGPLVTGALGAGLGALIGLATPTRVWAPLQPGLPR